MSTSGRVPTQNDCKVLFKNNYDAIESEAIIELI